MGHFKGKIGNAHAPCHVTGWYGVMQNHIIWNQRSQFDYSLYNFHGATTTFKRSLHGSTQNRFSGLGCRPLEEPGKKKPSKHLWCAILRIRRKETLKRSRL